MDNAFRLPTFTMYVNKGDTPHEGWSNSATWCFNLYLLQERSHYEALLALRRKDGKINYDRAFLLMRSAAYCTRNPILIDNWCEGMVIVSEIVDAFLSELTSGKKS
jgi:hypothetical protein